MTLEALEAQLVSAVGAAHVLVDPDLRAAYETDWTRRFTGAARAVVRPSSTAEVAAVLELCSAAGVPVVVQGGNTGLVGGGVPSPSGPRPILLSTTRLTSVGPVDDSSGQVTVGAGVTLSTVHAAARAAGLDFGLDLAARESATVGGLVSTNAGGVRVLRYGSMRDQVVGTEAVLADGRVISHLAGLRKDSTGYDLGHLLVGAEGTLAVLTAVRLQLVAVDTARAAAFIGVADAAAAARLLTRARLQLPGLAAAELMLPAGVALVADHLQVRAPLDGPHGAYLLLEAAGAVDPTDDLLELLGSSDEVEDAAVGSATSDRARLWDFRESHTEAISAAGVPVKLDVSVPLAALPALVEGLPAVVAGVAPTARLIVFGHLAEGNLHVNVLDVEPASAHAMTDGVLKLVASLAGSVSSEHGIGRAKAAWLGLSRTPAEIAVMRSVKAAFDPDGLLNPGVLFPAD